MSVIIWPGETIYLPFNTVDSTGAPITLAGSPTIAVYRDENDTQFTTGATLTVDKLSTNDAQTGAHFVACVCTDLTKYIPGHDFKVVLTAGTVGGISKVGLVVGRFRILDPAYLGVIAMGTASAVGASTITLATGHGLSSDHIGSTVYVRSSTNGIWQSRVFKSIASDTVTVDPAWTTALTGTVQYMVFATPPAPSDSTLLPAVSVASHTTSAKAELQTEAEDALAGCGIDSDGVGIIAGHTLGDDPAGAQPEVGAA